MTFFFFMTLFVSRLQTLTAIPLVFFIRGLRHRGPYSAH